MDAFSLRIQTEQLLMLSFKTTQQKQAVSLGIEHWELQDFKVAMLSNLKARYRLLTVEVSFVIILKQRAFSHLGHYSFLCSGGKMPIFDAYWLSRKKVKLSNCEVLDSNMTFIQHRLWVETCSYAS